ncbi:MAG TPA: hypothetical protein PLC47_00645 [Bacteroidales bacterium]|jgi:hypothetical protein|nr:hypothetical protein [Bacteroidales bacterium]
MRLFALMMAAVIFVGTVGLTINAHYCSTEKTLEKSLFASNISCDHSGETCMPTSSSVDSSKSCCKVNQNKLDAEACCTDFSHYVKLVTEFDLPNVKIVFNHFLNLAIRLYEIIIPVAEENTKPSYSEVTDDSGTLGNGIKFLIACSQLKLSHHQL